MSKTIETSRELLQYALNSVEYLAMRADDIGESNVPVADALRALLAAPVVERQEPVAYRCRHSADEPWFFSDKPGYWEWQPLHTSPPAPVAVVLPRYTCIGKGGEYELLGSAIGAGTLKDMSAIPVYRDTTTGQLFVRTPLDFATRMDCLDKVKELSQ